MSSVANIGQNTIEDINDELITGLTYKYANKYFKPLEDYLKSEDDSILNEALESGLNTLKFSIMNAVILSVSQYAGVKLIQASTLIYSYVKAGQLTKRLRNFSKFFENVPLVGKVGSRVLRFSVDCVVGDQNERIAIANMSNSSINNLASIISTERQNQILIKDSKVKHFNSQVKNSNDVKKDRLNQKLNLFNAKFKSGTWELNDNDKKLYEYCTGYKFKVNQSNYNKNFVDKLNSMSEVAKDTEGNILNAVQVHLDYIATHGFQRVK